MSQKARTNAILFLIALGFLLLQFIFELGIVYGTSLLSDSALNFIATYKNVFAAVHMAITILLVALAKHLCNSLGKKIK